jgi:nucleoside 2-deoxyribosyltransferase
MPQQDHATQSERRKAPAIRVYFAAPLFTQAEWQWNERLRNELRKLRLEITLPQDRAAPMLNDSEPFDPDALFTANTAGIDQAEVVVVVLDQADPDSGTCWECGYAFRAGRPIVGLRTDLRAAGDDPAAPTNLMLSRSCQEIIQLPKDKRDDIKWVAEKVARAVRAAKAAQDAHAAS